jgi:hypothetical protein
MHACMYVCVHGSGDVTGIYASVCVCVCVCVQVCMYGFDAIARVYGSIDFRVSMNLHGWMYVCISICLRTTYTFNSFERDGECDSDCLVYMYVRMHYVCMTAVPELVGLCPMYIYAHTHIHTDINSTPLSVIENVMVIHAIRSLSYTHIRTVTYTHTDIYTTPLSVTQSLSYIHIRTVTYTHTDIYTTPLSVTENVMVIPVSYQAGHCHTYTYASHIYIHIYIATYTYI